VVGRICWIGALRAGAVFNEETWVTGVEGTWVTVGGVFGSDDFVAAACGEQGVGDDAQELPGVKSSCHSSLGAARSKD
jgi:hypothetical protein